MEISCNNPIFDHERGEIICTDTGEVIDEERISLGPDWRAYTSEEWNKRAHANTLTNTVHDSGLITEIGSSTSKSLKETLKMKKLAILQRKLRVDRNERKLVETLTYLNNICNILGLPDNARETAAIILKKLFSVLQPRQNKLMILAIASVVLASRKHGIPVRVREITERFGVSEDEYWKLMSEIHMKIDLSGIKAYVDPRKFLPQIIYNLHLSQNVYLLASKIIDKLKKNGLTEGKDPAGIAAAVVYISSIIMNEKKTQREVAQAANVTEVTIRNRYRDIIDKVTITVFI